LVYVYRYEQMDSLATVQMYEKDEVLKMCKAKEVQDDNSAEEILKKLASVEIDFNEQEKVVEMLEYEYKQKMATTLKTKMSVTEIKEWEKRDRVPNYPGKKGTGSQITRGKKRPGPKFTKVHAK